MLNSPLKRTIEETVIISSAIIMFFAITPFSIYRYLKGEYSAAAFELVYVAIMCGIGLYVWKTRKTEKMVLATSLVYLTGVIIANYIIGTSVLFWIYPLIITVHFINSTRASLILISSTVCALAPILIEQKSTIELFSIGVTIIVCQLIGYLISQKLQAQYSQLEATVTQDSLTGARNKKSFDEHLKFLHNFAIRHTRQDEAVASIILFEIDDFSRINEKHGKLESDQTLYNLTQMIESNIRGIDKLYRFEDSSFAIIINCASAITASVVAEKIRYKIEMSNTCKQSHITASFGVAELQRLESTSRWVNRADKALLRAIRAGKNRAFIANYETLNNSDEDIKLVSV